MLSRGGATLDHDAELPAAPTQHVVGERRHTGHVNAGGLPIRSEDIEPQRGIRYIAWLFKGIAFLLVVVMVFEVALALSDPQGLARGALIGEAVRLLAFAGLLWGAADLAMVLIHSHYDLRATRILLTRQAALLERMASHGADPDASEPVSIERS